MPSAKHLRAFFRTGELELVNYEDAGSDELGYIRVWNTGMSPIESRPTLWQWIPSRKPNES